MAQDVGPEFKSQYCKKRKEERFKEKGKKKKGFALIKHVLYYLSQTSSPFCSGYFGDRISQTICLGWP
jgi:hypothetical protein